MRLTDAQSERQDFVDNQIFDLLSTLNTSRANLDWDIEMIADVRSCIQVWLIEKTGLESKEFYPDVE